MSAAGFPDKQDRANQLEGRLIDFAVRVIKLAGRLPNTPTGRHLSGQILRSGTSPASNYGEARGAESYSDFVHKMGIVLKELNETSIWLRIISKSGILQSDLMDEIIRENTELCKIITSTTTTAKHKLKLTRSPSNDKSQMTTAK